jgi:hypothetical protein
LDQRVDGFVHGVRPRPSSIRANPIEQATRQFPQYVVQVPDLSERFQRGEGEGVEEKGKNPVADLEGPALGRVDDDVEQRPLHFQIARERQKPVGEKRCGALKYCQECGIVFDLGGREAVPELVQQHVPSIRPGHKEGAKRVAQIIHREVSPLILSAMQVDAHLHHEPHQAFEAPGGNISVAQGGYKSIKTPPGVELEFLGGRLVAGGATTVRAKPEEAICSCG